jgi:hypothetical protein
MNTADWIWNITGALAVLSIVVGAIFFAIAAIKAGR